MKRLSNWLLQVKRERKVAKVVDGKVVFEEPLIQVMGKSFNEIAQKIEMGEVANSFILTTSSGKLYELKYEGASVSSLDNTAICLLQFGISEEEIGKLIILSENAGLQKQREETGREMPTLPEAKRVEGAVREAGLALQELCWVITNDNLYFFYKNKHGEVSELLKSGYTCIPGGHVSTAELLQWGICIEYTSNYSFTDDFEYVRSNSCRLYECQGPSAIKVNNQSTEDFLIRTSEFGIEREIRCRKGEVTTLKCGQEK